MKGADIETTLESLRQKYGFPGASLAIIRGSDATCDCYSVGLADREKSVPMLPSNRFPSGSTGKTFSSAVALNAFRECRLSLDTPIATVFADADWFQPILGGERISLRMLLNHTHGLQDYVTSRRLAISILHKRLTGRNNFRYPPQKLFSFVSKRPLLFEPGTRFCYGDTGYTLLGLAIEHVTGERYYDLLDRWILSPLGLKDTEPSLRKQFDGLASGYTWRTNMWLFLKKTAEDETFKFAPGSEWTGGGLIASARDLATWAHHRFGKGFLADDALFGASNSVAVNGYPERKYGLGFRIEETDLGQTLGHDGWFPGYRCIMRHYREHKLSIALQVNTDIKVPRRACCDILAAAALA